MTTTQFKEHSQSFSPEGVAFWHGSLSNIPDGWVLADGNNGTTDMTDRFVSGKSSYGASTSTGGDHTHSLTVSQIPSHQHSMTLSTSGSHGHSYTGGGYPQFGSTSNEYLGKGFYQSGSGTTSSDGSHAHSGGNTDAIGASSSIENRPQFYEVAIIVKL